jgi:prepilin-type N-terminal cleavage/methylation domain-containing protein
MIFKYKNKINKNKGFTLIELLVVISIIGMLSSIVLSSLQDARAKARDARRAMDMTQIYNALNLFYDKYGCLPKANSSACAGFNFTSDAGGWDYSYIENSFLKFLVDSGFMSKVPVDPVNNMTGDGTPSGTYAYAYYCYPPKYTGTNKGLVLRYFTEKPTRALKYKNNKITGVGDSTFICK